MLHSDEDEGEVDPVNHKYNISKIYDFPGFNQDPGENFFDVNNTLQAFYSRSYRYINSNINMF